MNNNLNFSKNVFGGTSSTKIAGNNITSYSQDGGRRSVEEVRQEQINAEHSINPNVGKEFQVNKGAYQQPINTSGMTGAFNVSNGQGNVSNPQVQHDLQFDATRARMQAMQNLNKRGF